MLRRPALTRAAVRPVLTTYANIAAASYCDPHQAAIILRAAIVTLIATPHRAQFGGTPQTWREARVPYRQTEVFRFRNTAIDNWECKLNA